MRGPVTICLASLGLFAFAAGCTFDDSGLALNDRCERSDDCVIGECVADRCVRPEDPDELDDPPDNAESADADRSDAGSCADGQVPVCGQCADPQQAIGQPCGSNCGSWQCAPGGGVRCEQPPTNACGGCGTLAAQPGDVCGAPCSRFQCDGREDVRCVPASPNACGGCTTLSAQPGTSCGQCDALWTCDGADSVRCDTSNPNFCGGCGGPAGAVRDAVCSCAGSDTPDPARYTCAGSSVVCADRPDSRNLGRRVDTDTSPPSEGVDVLQDGGDEDTFIFRGDDENGTDPLRPVVQLTVADGNTVRLCAAWEYAELGPLADPVCTQGQPDSFAGTSWCCSASSAAGNATVEIQNRRDPSGRLDTTPGADNDRGVLSLHVSSPNGSARCTRYVVRITL